MMANRLRWMVVVAASALLLLPGPADAQVSPEDKAVAESLFSQARDLMEAKRYAEACDKFEESHRIDPAPGTLLNLAVCHEEEGRIASAWSEFKEALVQARRDSRADRAELAQQHIDALEPRLPKLTIVVPEEHRVPGLVVRRGGVDLREGAWGAAIAIDPGDVPVEASAPGYADWSGTINVVEGKAAFLEVPLLEKLPEPAVGATDADTGGDTAAESDRKSWRTQHTVGAIVAGAGLVGLGVGAVFGAQALDKKSAYEAECGEVGGEYRCSASGQALNDEAYDAALVSNIAIGVGAGAVVVGAVLMVTGHGRKESVTARVRQSPRVSFSAGPDGAAAVLHGVFR